jgi:hypothetical protein
VILPCRRNAWHCGAASCLRIPIPTKKLRRFSIGIGIITLKNLGCAKKASVLLF